MTEMTQEKEKSVEESTTVVPLPKQQTEEGVPTTTSVLAPNLGVGEKRNDVDSDLEDDLEDEVWYDAEEPTSGDLLQGLAKPKVFEGPEVELQKEIVVKLEEAIPEVNKEAEAKHAEAELAFQTWDEDFKSKHPNMFGEPEVLKQYQTEFKKEKRKIPPKTYDADVMYIGSVVLDKIPPTELGEEQMIEDAELVYSEHSLDSGTNAVLLPRAADVEEAVVRNTLRTMIKAGQIDYLRSAGFVGKGWKIVVEVHYYRKRNKQQANLHKDTLGETLFVNLNYTNQDTMPGPEWIENPPLHDVHQKKLETSLPDQFNKDLSGIHQSPQGTRIETEDIPPNGVVAFVDEAIHHATPMLGHRPVTVAGLKKFLAEDPDFKNGLAKAQKAYSWEKSTGLWTLIKGTFKSNMGTGYTDQEILLWQALMDLWQKGDQDQLRRPELLAIGMSEDQVDRLVSGYGTSPHTSVSIPTGARTDGGTNRLPLKTDDSKKPPITLKRTMSQRSLNRTLPVDPGGDRRFFRTWVRAVRM